MKHIRHGEADLCLIQNANNNNKHPLPFRDGVNPTIKMKTITTGTEIAFKKTGEKYTLTQTETGFDVKQIRLSKNTPHEPYSFQEFLDLYESEYISIEGFQEADAPLVKSILTNYIHATDIARLNSEKEELVTSNLKLTGENSDLIAANKELTTANTALADTNKALNKKVAELNTALEAMEEK